MTPKIKNKSQIRQYGEILRKTFNNIGFFVDVGANDGIKFSNTKVLADNGWGGLLIEPLHKQFTKCKQLYDDNDKIKVLNIGVSDKEEVLTLNCCGPFSTFDHYGINYNRILEKKTLNHTQKIQCYTLDQILQQHNIEKIDLMDIDVEGWEDKVMKGFSIDKYLPTILILELHAGYHPSTKRKSRFRNNDTIRYCRKKLIKNYKLIYSDHINDIYKLIKE